LSEIGQWQEKIYGQKRLVKAKYGESQKEISDENLILKEMK
jgi:hypothetical protein